MNSRRGGYARAAGAAMRRAACVLVVVLGLGPPPAVAEQKHSPGLALEPAAVTDATASTAGTVDPTSGGTPAATATPGATDPAAPDVAAPAPGDVPAAPPTAATPAPPAELPLAADRAPEEVPAREVCERYGAADWLEVARNRLARDVCAASVWFDRFFTSAEIYDHSTYRQANGWVSLGGQYYQYTGFEPTVRLRATFPLPYAQQRLRAFVGVVDRETFVRDRSTDFDTLPTGIDQDQRGRLFLGVTFDRVVDESGFDASVGVRGLFPPNLYTRLAYRFYQPLQDDWQLRARHTLFWEVDEGFGMTPRVDLERILDDARLLRFTATGTWSEDTIGFEWATLGTLYLARSETRAYAWQLGVYGRTDNEVPIVDYTARMLVRQRLHREWLWLEAQVGVGWPRELLIESRRPSYLLGLAVQMQFGPRYAERQAAPPTEL